MNVAHMLLLLYVWREKFSRCAFVERVLHYQCWFFYYFREMKLTHNGIVFCTKRQKELYTLESAERGEKNSSVREETFY